MGLLTAQVLCSTECRKNFNVTLIKTLWAISSAVTEEKELAEQDPFQSCMETYTWSTFCQSPKLYGISYVK